MWVGIEDRGTDGKQPVNLRTGEGSGWEAGGSGWQLNNKVIKIFLVLAANPPSLEGPIWKGVYTDKISGVEGVTTQSFTE